MKKTYIAPLAEVIENIYGENLMDKAGSVYGQNGTLQDGLGSSDTPQYVYDEETGTWVIRGDAKYHTYDPWTAWDD